MARRPTQSGFAPVSLHVIPGKAALHEEEQTTIDPGPPRGSDDGWDDAGTSVDDGGSIDTTSSRGDVGQSTVDEPTVEDQARPLPPLSLVPPLPKPAAPRVVTAKLVVIGGNDTGRDFPLDPSRPLTVGRAIDNDVVLTDIAVSRKHLDLSFDGEYWVMRDRGSGNGTLVNERIEDGSCRLHQGDRIEIGNTIFRFEHPGGAQPQAPLGWGQGNDDDELSTVAGRSLRSELPGTAPRGPDAVATVPVQKQRLGALEKKSPPPPTRSRSPSSTQPPQAAGERLVLPATPPGASSGAPSAGEPRVTIRPSSVIESAIPESMLSGRHLTTTARVEPRSFNPAVAYPFVVRPASPARRYATIAAILFAVVGIGVIAKATSKDEPGRAAAALRDERGSVAAQPAPIQVKTVVVPVPQPLPEPAPVPAPTSPVPPPAPKAVRPSPEPATAPAPMPAPTPAPPPAPAPKAELPRAELPKAVAIAPAPKTVPAPKAVAVAPAPAPKVEPPKAVVAPKPKQPAPAPKVETSPRPKQPAAPKIATSTRAPVETSRPKPPPPAPRDDTSSDAAPKGSPKSTLAAKKKAAQQYADGDFTTAAATLRTAADTVDPQEAMPMRVLAGEYEAVGEAMNAGAAAAARPVDAFAAYSRALQADRRAGGAQGSEIRDKLGEFAPKAAASYMAKANYEAAKRAADAAADFGSGSSPLVQQVRASLEKKANEFLATAQKTMPAQPEEAKGLLRRILKMVAPDSPTYQKAYQLLNTRQKPRDDDE